MNWASAGFIRTEVEVPRPVSTASTDLTNFEVAQVDYLTLSSDVTQEQITFRMTGQAGDTITLSYEELNLVNNQYVKQYERSRTITYDCTESEFLGYMQHFWRVYHSSYGNSVTKTTSTINGVETIDYTLSIYKKRSATVISRENNFVGFGDN